jgi:catechol 2,3-dioxygenase-like lactoylglutathione lyase family enzyme
VPITVARLDHVQITAPPALLAATVAFYRDLLGLEEMRSSEGAPPGSPAWLRCGAVKVHLSADPVGADDQARAKRHVCFVVTDLAETERTLRAAGVEMLPDERPVRGWPRVFVRDPAGNRVELARPVTG